MKEENPEYDAAQELTHYACCSESEAAALVAAARVLMALPPITLCNLARKQITR